MLTLLLAYIRLDERIPADHPLRVIRQLVDAALAELSRAFAKLYAWDGRLSIPRALDDAKSKAVCIQKRAHSALALAESIARGRRLIDTFGG